MTAQNTEELRRDIVSELTNAYYETYRYERPNDSTEQLIAFCRDLAENEVDELITAQTKAVLDEVERGLEEHKESIYIEKLTGGSEYGVEMVRVASVRAVLQKMKESTK
jgi:L-arabinose isomerase